MAAATKLAGKTGRVQWGSNNLFMRDWSLPLKADIIPSDTFEKAANAGDGQYYKTGLVGLVGAEAEISGFWDNTASQMPSGPTYKIQPGALIQSAGGAVASVFLCFDITSGVGYTITGKVSGIKSGTKVDGAAEFSFSIFVESCVYTSQT